jgi:hypothetical protein
MRAPGAKLVFELVVLIMVGLVSTSCATVPHYKRSRLADPMMSLTDDPLETYRKQKLYNSREGAAGGDGAAAGGGCACH